MLLAVRAYSLELKSFSVGMAKFCLPALGVRGLLRLKWLGSNHKNRASALLHAPTCPTVGEAREVEAK